ncbi:hypothetical protein GCM10009716_39620 [Streptomyces sodiiphilus]|uniref:Uncharacterized protein n=1 Tax=Streptomyces sodiiphilus TaxID=226217 RepID=A0ABN2PQ07_9ACTN
MSGGGENRAVADVDENAGGGPDLADVQAAEDADATGVGHVSSPQLYRSRSHLRHQRASIHVTETSAALT